MLDDDSLLNVFYLYRPFFFGEDDENKDHRLIGGEGRWDRGRWWYKLAHVCHRWRNIVLGSAAYLGISLICTNGTPIADMLTHSPSLPLAIDYMDNNGVISAEDEEGAILALKQYDRVRHVRLAMPPTSLQKFITTMSDEYSILEYLIIWHPLEDKTTILTFPETLQALHLRHLALIGFAFPIGSRLLTTAVGLVNLFFAMVNPSTYFHPNTLLQWLSFMPQLETLRITFLFPDRIRHVEGQRAHMAITTPVSLPNLRLFGFYGVTAYSEALLDRISTPRLEKLGLAFLNQLTFSVPRLLHFVNTTETLRFKRVRFGFSSENVDVEVYSHEEVEMFALHIIVNCCHLDWQVSSAAQIFNALSPVLSAVEHLTLEHREHSRSSEEHNEVDPTEWRKLLGSFRNVKTLHIATGLVEELARCLHLDDRELPLEVLSELQELTYFGSGDTGDAFTSFVEARKDVGRSITLLRRSPSPDSSSPAPPLQAEPPSIIPASVDAGSDLKASILESGSR